MSGRSAVVRQKINKQAEKKERYQEQRHYEHEDQFVHGYANAPDRPNFSATTSYLFSPRTSRRRQSVSSQGSNYGSGYVYPPPPRKPRPIVIQSAIEKSDFRTHLDGMSSSLRGKLGRILRGGGSDTSSRRQRPGTSTSKSESDARSTTHNSTSFTPSIDAVPSLSPSTSPSEMPSQYQSFRTPTTYTSRSKQQQESVIHKIRRFEGGGKLPQLGWKSLANNPELWDDSGDTFVYMYMRGSKTKPPPSFRVHSRAIKESGSKIFMDILFHPNEPEGWPRFYPHDDPEETLSPEDPMDPYESYSNGLPSGMQSPMSNGDALRPLSVSKRFTGRAPRGIQHEIYVPWPGQETGIHSTIWHITTRNFFAIMYDASSLVGTTLLEALSKLSERVTMYPDYLDKHISKVAWLTDYIVRHQFDDVRNNPSYAASLLAFSETQGVQWREGYIEAFVHCAGMLNLGLQTIPEWRFIAPHTKMFLQNASLEIEERIHRAQAWLLSFDFTEMWPTTSAPASSARACFDRLRKWLCRYYENAFLHWPPTNEHTWLTHDIVVRLSNDFHGLYDYLVDRDIMFDGAEYRPGQKWAIQSKSGQSFRADTSDLPLTDILLTFDARHDFPHIPHPYPQTPPSVPVPGSKSKSAFTFKKPTSPADLLAQSRRKALSYAEASNVYILRDQYMHTDLVTNFIRFEQGDALDALDPFEARRGRWLLIYGVLQVLATISVDAPNLRYKEGVQYHLSPQMKGIVPWADHGSPPEEEADHSRSHCWVVPDTWGPPIVKARAGAHKPILWGQFGDGRSRADSPSLSHMSTDRTPQLKVRDQQSSDIGRKRAEEWVATNGGAADIGSDGDTTADTADGIGSFGRCGSGTVATTIATGERSSGERASSGEGIPRGPSREGVPRGPSREGVLRGPSREGVKRVGSRDFARGFSSREGLKRRDSGDVHGGAEYDPKWEARRRRAQIHGFTDFQVPKDW